MMETTGYSLADIAAATGNNNRNDDGMFGGNGAWWIILFLIWGAFGYGGYGGFGGGRGGAGSPEFQGIATRADINEGFALNDIQNGIRGIQQGICDSTYALNNSIQQGFNSTQMGMMQGFNGVDKAFCTLQAQIADCCCRTNENITSGFAQTNYNLATQFCNLGNQIQSSTRDIIENQNAVGRSITDFLVQDKISSLQNENQALRFQASQSNQNAYLTATIDASQAELLRRLATPQAVPAYVVPNPNCCYNPFGYPYNNGGNCGCNTNTCCGNRY